MKSAILPPVSGPAMVLALAALASAAPAKFRGTAGPLGAAAHESLDFIGWDKACGAAVEHLGYASLGKGLQGVPVSWRIGALTIPPAADGAVADWVFETRKDRFWSEETARRWKEKLSRGGYCKAGFVETVRDAPEGDQPGLSDSLRTTRSFKTAGSPGWPPADFLLDRVHYNPTENCALFVFKSRAGQGGRFRLVLARLLNPGVRLERSRLHAVNGILLYNKASDLDGAEAELAIAVRLAPESAFARYHHSLILAAQGRFDEALPELGAAVKLDLSYAAKAKEDLEFEPLREDGRFREIVLGKKGGG